MSHRSSKRSGTGQEECTGLQGYVRGAALIRDSVWSGVMGWEGCLGVLENVSGTLHVREGVDCCQHYC